MNHDALVEVDRGGFQWVILDGDAVAYDSFSGDTHRLYRPAGSLIRVLQDSSGPVRWGDVLAACKPDSTAKNSDYHSSIESAAETLISIGLLQYSAIDTP